MSQCHGTNANGSRCKRPAGEDSEYCHSHSAPAPIAEGEDAPSDISDEDTSVPEPSAEAEIPAEEPAEAEIPAEEPAEAEIPAEEAPEPEKVPNPTVPEGTATTFNVNEPPPEPSETPEFAHEGRPQEYMILRTNNSGWVIEEKWQYLASFEEIEEVIQSEVAAGRAGSLHRGNRAIASWGGHGPARI